MRISSYLFVIPAILFACVKGNDVDPLYEEHGTSLRQRW